MAALRVNLLPEERAALDRLAWRERRDPRAQAALIIRRALESAGLLVSVAQPVGDTQPAKAKLAP